MGAPEFALPEKGNTYSVVLPLPAMNNSVMRQSPFSDNFSVRSGRMDS